MTIINAESFTAATTDADNIERGTVEVTIRGEARRVNAIRMPKYGWTFAYDMVGRYQSAGKEWPATVRHVMLNGKPMETVTFGRDDRSPKFRKENMIWFKKGI